MCKGSNDFNKITNYEKLLELMQLVKNLLPKKHVLIEIKHTVACNISQKNHINLIVLLLFSPC